MPSPRWRKVLRDLWGNKTRTVLVVLSIAVGIFAIGLIAGSQVLFSRELNSSWAAINPADATLYTEPFDDELLWTIRDLSAVEEADGRRGFALRFKAGPASQAATDEIPWRNLNLYAYPDYDNIRVSQLLPKQGMWPPPEQALLLERGSLSWIGVQEGDTITVEAPNGRLRELEVVGVVHDLNEMSPTWTGYAAAYISIETLEWLGIPRSFDELNVIVAGNPKDKAAIAQATDKVREQVENTGRSVNFTWIPTPGKHPADDVVQPILLILGVLGMLALALSAFLVVNTLQALLAQQVRQIGIMKAIGARNSQIMGVYFGMVLAYCLLALLIAVPAGAQGALALTQFMAGLINFDITSAQIPLQVLALEIAVGLFVPLLAALFPILSAVRVTAREAMSDYGLTSSQVGSGPLDRILERIRGLSRPLLLSLRNTFRRKGRLALTLTTLVLSGAIFVAVFSVRSSLLGTLDEMFAYVNYDALVAFRRAYRIEHIEQQALTVPGVVAAEAWRFGTARRVRADDTESDTILIRAPQADTNLVNATLVSGRMLLPEDENAIVINTYLLKDDPDIRVGDTIDLKINNDTTAWRVVGIIKGTPPIGMAYVNYPYFARLMGELGRAGVVFVVTERHDATYQNEISQALETHFEQIGMQVASTQASSTERNQIASQFNTLVVFLLLMAIILATVGAIGLMGTMSLNVLERTREIGVMRAIGASDGAILRIVIVEGIIIGLLSWLLGTIVAIPLSRVLSEMVGQSIMETSLSFSFSVGGMFLWLALVVIMSGVASFWPARNASRVTVRDVLAYE